MVVKAKSLAEVAKLILSRAAAIQGTQVTVGVLGPLAEARHENSTLTVAEIAAVQHTGDGRNIPARPFLTIAQAEHKEQLQDLLARATKAVMERGADPEKALGLVGSGFVGMIQQTIANGVSPANAPSTIARKGSSTPLIDTGQMRASIAWRIKKK